jgi:hypothetical protein
LGNALFIRVPLPPATIRACSASFKMSAIFAYCEGRKIQ